MHVESLRYFLEVARTESLSKASASLFVSQQGLSKALAALERSLGVRLFDRSSKGSALTPEGERLLGQARAVVAEYDLLLQEVKSIKEDSLNLQGSGIVLVTPLLCITAVIKEMRASGYLQNLVLRQAETQEAFESIGDASCLHLVDLPSHRYCVEELEKDYDVTPLVQAKVGVLSRRDLLPGLPARLSIEQASALPLAIIDTSTTRDMYGYIFRDHPIRNAKTFSTDENEVDRGVIEGRFAALTVSLHWNKLAAEVKEPGLFTFSELDTDVVDLVAFVRPRELPPNSSQEAFMKSFTCLFEEIQRARMELRARSSEA